MELSYHPLSPGLPALYFTVWQRSTERVCFQGMAGLRPGFAIVFSGLTVLGKVQVLMPINHGQQGRRQPVFQVFINGKALQGFADPSHQKLTETAKGFIGLRNFFITSLWSLMPCSPARSLSDFPIVIKVKWFLLTEGTCHEQPIQTHRA